MEKRKMITVRVSPEDYERYKQAANKARMSSNAWCHKLLEAEAQKLLGDRIVPQQPEGEEQCPTIHFAGSTLPFKG